MKDKPLPEPKCPVCGSLYGTGHGQSCRTGDSIHKRLEQVEMFAGTLATTVTSLRDRIETLEKAPKPAMTMTSNKQ